MTKAARIIGVLILLTGLVPGILAVFFFMRTSSFLKNANCAQGTVTDHEYGGNTYHTVFAFKDARGNEHEIHSSVGTNPPSHQKGEKVRVYYDPQNPKDARIDSFLSLWFGPFICGALAVVPIVIGSIFIFVAPIVIRAVVKDISQLQQRNG